MIRIKTNIIPSSKATLTELYNKIKELDQEKEFKVFVSDQKNTRSLQQNKYYWGVVLPLIAGHTGYTISEIHEVCKYKFNKSAFVDPETGEVLDIGASTATLKVDEFITYIDAIKEWAMTLGVVIPEAGELPDEIIVLHESKI